MRIGVHGPNHVHVEAHRKARMNGWTVIPLRGPDVDEEAARLGVTHLWPDRPGEPGPGYSVVLRTSGSTGEPVPVELTDDMLQAHRDACADRIGHDAEARWLLCLPLTHMGGIGVLDRCLRDGAPLAVEDDFDTGTVATALDEATHVSLVPIQLRRLLAVRSHPPAGLRCVLLGGDAADETLVQEAIGNGWPIYCTYGMTETCGQVATATPSERQTYPGTVGRPLPGVHVETDATGAVIVSGPTVADRRHATGDEGRLIDGRLYITGRTADRIITGGKNVDARRVAACLLDHPDISDAAVVGIPDSQWGEAVAAHVEGPVTRADAEAWCKARLERHEVPRSWRAGPVPRNAMGKVDRVQVAAGFTPV